MQSMPQENDQSTILFAGNIIDPFESQTWIKTGDMDSIALSTCNVSFVVIDLSEVITWVGSG